MEGMILKTSIANMAKNNGWGYGSYLTNKGSSIKLCSDKMGITRLFEVKSGRLLSAEAAKGNNETAAMLDKYAVNAIDKDEADFAFISSFCTIA